MKTSFWKRARKPALAVIMAVLLPTAAQAWTGGWGCDPQTAYLEEYGFLHPFGPSRGDMQRLRRDEWRAATRPLYYGGYTAVDDPVTKAMRRRCYGSRYQNRYRPYWW